MWIRQESRNLLKYSYGPFLDNLAAMKGITREQAKPARTMVRFTLSGIRPDIVEIPVGTRVTNGDVYFQTEAYAAIQTGQTQVDVPCACMSPGTHGNDLGVGEINVLVDPVPYVAKVSNTEPTTGGADIEDDDTLKDRIYIAPSKYSVGSPEDAYYYWARTYNANISDVLIYSENPAEVIMEFIMQDGRTPVRKYEAGTSKFLGEQTDPAFNR